MCVYIYICFRRQVLNVADDYDALGDVDLSSHHGGGGGSGGANEDGEGSGEEGGSEGRRGRGV